MRIGQVDPRDRGLDMAGRSTTRGFPGLPRALLLAALITLSACSAITGMGGGDESLPTRSPRIGECYSITPAQIKSRSHDTRPVACTARHTSETFAVGTFPASLHAAVEDGVDDSVLAAHVVPTCERQFQRFLGGDKSLTMRSTFTWVWFRPPAEAWQDGARWWRCDAVAQSSDSAFLAALPDTVQGALSGDPDDRWLACKDGPSVTQAPTTPCSTAHAWRAVSTATVGEPAETYPGKRVIRARTRQACSDSVEAWLDFPIVYDYGFTWFGEAEWEAGNRRSICWAKTSR